MKVKIRFFANDQKNICEDTEIANFLAKELASPWLIWGSEKAQRYVSAFSEGEGSEMRLHFDLSRAKVRHYDYFILVPKHVIRESDKVYLTNLDYADALPIHHKNSYGAFKVRGKVFADKIKPIEDRIWSMEFFEAFVAADALVEEMLATFSGLRKAEVLHCRKHEPITGWSSFYSEHWLAKLFKDDTTFTKKLDCGSDYIETHGLYTAQAEDLNKMPDIFRMPLVYNSSGDSQYVVSKRVMEYWFSKGITKSFFLQPLLISGSEQHKAYLDLWHEMVTALSVNPKNTIE